MGQKKYKAFISYSHKDAKISKWLHQSLESYRVPKHLVGTKNKTGVVPGRLFPVFRDREDLAATTHMSDAILEALQDSEYLIVICTPSSAQSKLVNREIQEFKRLNGSDNILCLIAGGVPFSRNPDHECFSELLQRHIAPDGTPTDYAPEGLAADIRPGSDGKSAAVSKLVAGMLGVQLNILVRREMQQQKRKLVGALAGSFIVLAVVTTLLFKTVEAQRLAEQRSRDAADLLAYLHESVFEALDAGGDTTAQETLIRAVFDHYSKLDFKNADATFLTHWSGGALRLGQNLERQGKNEEAAKLFSQMREFGIRFTEDHPREARAWFRRQNAEFFYGYLKLRTGAYDEAEKSFRTRLATTERFLSDLSTSMTDEVHLADWQSTLADGQALLAKLLAGPQNQTKEAETLLLESIRNRLISIEQFAPNTSPYRENNTGLKISLTSAYLYLGDLYRRLGRLADAQEYYQKRIDLLSDLLENAPNDLNVTRRKSVAELGLAKIFLDRGETAAALSLTREQVNTFRMLAERNPSSVLWFSGLVEAQNQLTDICVTLNTCENINHELEEAHRLSSELFTRDGDRPHYRLTHYRARMLQAQQMFSTGNIDGAQAELNALIRTLNAEEKSFIRTDGAMEIVARTFLLASQLADRSEDMDTAKRHAETVVEIVDARPDPWAEAQAYQALALAYLGNDGRARNIRVALDDVGFDYKVQQSLVRFNPTQHHVVTN